MQAVRFQRPASLLAGVLLAALTLWLAFRGTDTAALRDALQTVQFSWLVLAFASVVLTLAFGIVRWRVVLGPGASWRVLTDGYVIGQTLNILLPIRLGEVARAYIASRGANLHVVRTLTTIAVERFIDLVIAGVAMALLLSMAALPSWVLTPGRALVMTAALAAVAAVLGLNSKAMALMTRAALRAVPGAWRARLERQLTHAADGLSNLRSWKTSVSAWILSAAIFLASAATNLLLFYAFGFQLSVVVAVTLILALQVGTSIASVPGNLGVFHFVTVLVLAAHGIAHDAALAYAIVLYAVAIVPKLVFGSLRLSMAYGWSAVTRGESLNDEKGKG